MKKDLFEDIDKLPQEVQDVIKKHSENWDETYENCEELIKDLEPLGFTCDYYLDGTPFDLKEISTKE